MPLCNPSPPSAHDARNLPSAHPSPNWYRRNSSSAHVHAEDTSPHRSKPSPQPAKPKPTVAPTAKSAPPNTHTPPAFFPERWNRCAFSSFSRNLRILHPPPPVNSICRKLLVRLRHHVVPQFLITASRLQLFPKLGRARASLLSRAARHGGAHNPLRSITLVVHPQLRWLFEDLIDGVV
jgi:hypothetical protein